MILIRYYCPYWGMRPLPMEAFLQKAKDAGYDGVEIALDPDLGDISLVKMQCDDLGLDLIAQHPYAAGDTVKKVQQDYLSKLERILEIGPVMVNCHTGRDYFSIDENLLFITAADQLSRQFNIKVVHEIHRGRFSFCAPLIGHYLDAFPRLELTADFSHWCVVSESLLENQKEIMDRVIHHCGHLHARVGYAQGPQVPHPFAPEYKTELDQHLIWWKEILKRHLLKKEETLSVTCEFGPAPYLHTIPFTGTPVASQWELNLLMKNYLQQNLY